MSRIRDSAAQAWSFYDRMFQPPEKKYHRRMKSLQTSFPLIEGLLFFLLPTELFSEPRELLLPSPPITRYLTTLNHGRKRKSLDVLLPSNFFSTAVCATCGMPTFLKISE